MPLTNRKKLKHSMHNFLLRTFLILSILCAFITTLTYSVVMTLEYMQEKEQLLQYLDIENPEILESTVEKGVYTYIAVYDVLNNLVYEYGSPRKVSVSNFRNSLRSSIHSTTEYFIYAEHATFPLASIGKAILCSSLLVALLCIFAYGIIDKQYNSDILRPLKNISNNLKVYSDSISNNENDYLLSGYVDLPKEVEYAEYLEIQEAVKNLIIVATEANHHLSDMQYECDHDALTNLYNRTRFNRDIENKYVKGNTYGVIFFDLNGLKAMNDTRGHDFGDILLLRAANSFKSVFKDTNCSVYRYGGDEFVAVITNCKEYDIAEYLRQWKYYCSRQNETKDIKVQCAYGYAIGAEPVEVLLKTADERMYSCKDAQKNS